LEREAASLVAYGDYILRQVHAARDLARRIKAEDIQRYVLDYLAQNYPGCRFVQDAGDPTVVDVDLSVAAKNALSTYLRERRAGVGTALARSDPAPVRCRFENRLQAPLHKGEEVVNQFHPLVRFIARAAEEEHRIQYPAVAARISKDLLPVDVPAGDYRIAVSRWTFEALRTTEQLWFGVEGSDGSSLFNEDDSERFVMAVAEAGGDWASAAAETAPEVLATEVEGGLLVRARQAFERHSAQIEAQNEDRAEAQLRSLETHREQQRRKYEELYRRHLQRGNRGLAQAQQTNLARLEARIERERQTIEEKRRIRKVYDEVCVGIVRVT
jgi:hypothetical protein